MTYSTGAHTTYHNRYHIVWITKYRYKVLTKEMRFRIRDSHQICNQLGVKIIKGVLSNNHTHMFVEIPQKISISDFMRCIKGCTSRKIQQEFQNYENDTGDKDFGLGVISVQLVAMLLTTLFSITSPTIQKMNLTA